MARHLGDEQPLYGLQPPGLDGQREPLTRVEDLAEYFAAQVLAVRPAGPSVIAGFCAGGMIAFELGRQLSQAGAAVVCIALFGAPYPTIYRPLPRLRQRVKEQTERVVRHTRALASLAVGAWPLYVAEKMRHRQAKRAAERPTKRDRVLVLRAKVERATLAAARRYTPSHFAGRVNLFVPSKDWVRVGAEPLRWRSVAPHTETYFGPEGCDSDNMLREPYAPVFAELFRQSGGEIGMRSALEAQETP